MKCPACGHENRVGAKFCEACASSLQPVCASCGAALRPTAKFCDECGAATGAAAARSPAVSPDLPAAAPGPVPTGERRQLTVLFCDLVSSTPLSQQLDAEEWRELLAQYQQAAAGAVARFGGHVAKNLGDGLLIYFGWPSARGDDPERAVRAGLAIIEQVSGVGSQKVEYAFKHPLPQEVAYRSQLGARRAQVHAVVARAIDLPPVKSVQVL